MMPESVVGQLLVGQFFYGSKCLQKLVAAEADVNGRVEIKPGLVECVWDSQDQLDMLA